MWPLIGNEHITKYLEKSIVNKNVNNAYIFSGPDNLGKTTLAIYFAKILLCQENKDKFNLNPCNKCKNCLSLSKDFDDEEQNICFDFYCIKKDKEKKNIGIGQIRDLIINLNMSSFSDSYKVVVIKHAENMTIEASNAILKTMEETKKKVVIILTVNDLEKIPKTIQSRSQIFNFYPVKSDKIYDNLVNNYNVSRGYAKDYARLCLGRPALAQKFLENRDFFETYEKRANIFLSFWGESIHKRFLFIEEIVDKNKGQEASIIALRTLEIWQGVLRDLLMLQVGRKELIRHKNIAESNEYLKIEITNIFDLFISIKRAKEEIESNVNPVLALQGVAVEIK